jgi:RecA/RadA recombinase
MITEKMKKPTREVLLKIHAMTTSFLQFDKEARNGLPLKRIVMLHGESAQGKTQFMLAQPKGER